MKDIRRRVSLQCPTCGKTDFQFDEAAGPSGIVTCTFCGRQGMGTSEMTAFAKTPFGQDQRGGQGCQACRSIVASARMRCGSHVAVGDGLRGH